MSASHTSFLYSMGNTVSLRVAAPLAKHRRHPQQLRRSMNTQPPEDQSALVRAIVELQTAVSQMRTEQAETKRRLSEISDYLTYEINGTIFTHFTKVNTNPTRPMATPSLELPESLMSIPGMEILPVNAPQIYVKFLCQVCLREWIVPISSERLQNFQPPNRCRWCDSSVWNDPAKAQTRSDQRTKRHSASLQIQSQSQFQNMGDTTP